MPRTRRRAVMVLALAFVTSPVPSAQGTAPSATVPFSVYDGGAVVVAVTIGGAGPFRFLIDTGSTRSAITARLARQLRSPLVALTAVVTPAGDGARSVALIHGLSVGHARLLSVAAMVVPDGLSPRAGRVDGLLGQDVLANQSYTIDYQRRQLTWHAGEVTDFAGHRLPLTEANGLYFVSLPAMAATVRPMRLVVDSGAETIVLFGGPDGINPPAAQLGTGLLRTALGTRIGRHIRLDRLDLGGFSMRDQTALLMTEPESSGLLGDGLLPLHLFARVTFDGSRTLIVATQ